jgi:ribose transport system substrate-binding protein
MTLQEVSTGSAALAAAECYGRRAFVLAAIEEDPLMRATSVLNGRSWTVAALVAVACAILGAAAATAGSSRSGAAKGTIAISFPNATKQGAVNFEMKFAKKKAKQLGYKLVINDPGTDTNAAVNTLKTWIQQRVNAIVTVALDPKVYEGIAQQAMSNDIKWVTYGAPLPKQDAIIDLQLRKGGVILGRLAGQWITRNKNRFEGAKANVALLTFESGEWARQRRDGIVAGLNSTAGGRYTIVARQDALSQTEGLNVTNTLLQAHPDLNVVLAVEETATEGAYQAFLNKGHKKNDPRVFLGGIDGTLKALQLLQAGNTMYRGSAALSLKSIGNAMITVPDNLLHGGKGNFLVPIAPLKAGDPRAAQFLSEWR